MAFFRLTNCPSYWSWITIIDRVISDFTDNSYEQSIEYYRYGKRFTRLNLVIMYSK